jgi:IS30 family transposase
LSFLPAVASFAMQHATPFPAKTVKRIADAIARGLRRREVCRELGIHHSRLYREIERSAEFRTWLEAQEMASKWDRENRIFELHPMRRRYGASEHRR